MSLQAIAVRCACVAAATLPIGQAHAQSAQVSTDGTLGVAVLLAGPNATIPDALGLRAGPNLLHSFSLFNIPAGRSATFTGSFEIQNIVARITGGPSTIDGSVRSTIPGSNLFLVNPSGIVFGPTASVSVPGSFHVSTAPYIRLADGTRIPMRYTDGVTITAAPPAAFGFDGPAAAITLNGTQLRASEGRSLSVVGGDVTLSRASTGRVAALVAPSGNVSIVAAQSSGEAVIGSNGLQPQGFGAMGNVTLQDGAVVSATEGSAHGGAGAVAISGGTVTIRGSDVESRTAVGNARGISVSGTDAVVIDGSTVASTTTGAGAAGPLALSGGNITLSNGSLVDTSCDPGCTTGPGGRLSVNATGSVTLIGDNASVPTYLVSNSFGGGRTGDISISTPSLTAQGNSFIQGIATKDGNGSSITVASGSITLTDGAQIDVSARGAGHGGTINVANGGDIHVEGVRAGATPSDPRLPSGFFANSEASGSAGDIVISTRTLEVLAGGEVSSSARAGSSGNGGRVSIAASGALRVAGTDDTGKSSGIVSNTFSSGIAGDVVISADTLEISDRGRIQTQSQGSGHAGAVQISGRTMTLTGQGQVSSDARASGDGGTIDVTMAERIAIDGQDSGLFAKTYAGARGGSVHATAPAIEISNGGGVFAGTDGSGPGGDISVTAGTSLDVHDDGSITSESRATGLAGSIAVNAGESMLLRNNGRITTAARLADGGDIAIAVGSFASMSNALIETQVGSGNGNGGNVDFRVPTLVMDGSTISANAYGGNGGNIHLGTTTFVPSGDSAVTASSKLGIDGTITLDSPALDPTSQLLVPPPAFVDVAAILAGRCGPRLAGRASSLVVLPVPLPAAGPDEWRVCAPVAMAK